MQVKNRGCRYNLRSKRSHNFLTEEDSSQLLSPTPHLRKRKAVQLSEGGSVCNSDESRTQNESHVKLSHSKDEVVDEGSEASAERYAIIALNHYNSKLENFELVDIGPLAVGNILNGRRIFHLNYKAKENDIAGAEVQTFFSELMETEEGGVRVSLNVRMGPSDSFPEKADTLGCLYCQSHNIHHAEGFLNGGAPLWDALCSQVKSYQKYIEKRIKKKNYSPKFKHPGVEYIGKDKNADRSTARYATVALRLFNVEQGTNFELVKTGPMGGVALFLGLVRHLNFEAKTKDDPEAPIQTFFAQVITRSTFIFANFCKHLGPSDSLPDQVKLNGCCYCKPRGPHVPLVRHPPGPGYLVGRETKIYS